MEKSVEKPTEWETDKNGKRFRRVGNILEYEPEVMTTCGVVPIGQMNSVVKKNMNVKPVQEKLILCPFRGLGKCRPECVFRVGENCTFGEQKERTGQFCPFAGRNCSKNCGLFNNGCKL